MHLAKAGNAKYDTINSKVVLWISYKHSWPHPVTGEFRSNQNYYMKFLNEKTEGDDKYDGLGTEMYRVCALIESTYKDQKYFKTMALYQNSNHGGRNPDRTIKNLKIFQVHEDSTTRQLVFWINPVLPGDTNDALRNYIMEFFERLRLIHGSI
ncbi:MAG TPA: hypothetical protein VGE44_09425 [Daejeonella sp.]|uniref:hypothetical protein n=1 Tax=Daejeonella sp. TaxID=2805397 RepID=UPI002ED9F60C